VGLPAASGVGLGTGGLGRLLAELETANFQSKKELLMTFYEFINC
jgi:hypothetical protein